MYSVKSETSAENTKICCGCLSTDRKLSPLIHYDLFDSLLGNKNTLEDLKCFNVLLCWECTALLRRVAALQTRLQDAQCFLKLAHDQQIPITTLSTLGSSHRQGYDYVIEETIEEKPDIEQLIDNFTTERPDIEHLIDNCTTEIKQEIEYDHFESDSGFEKVLDEKVPNVKKEKKHVKVDKEKDLLKIDNGIDFKNFELYFTKVHLSETEVQESLAKDRDDNDSISRPLKCGICGFRFMYKSDLQTHKREYHNKRSLLIKCPVCGEKHKNKSELMLHWRRCHPVNRCLKCARVVERDFDRSKHLYMHRFTYRCKQCDVEFNDRLLYSHHARHLHSRYECDHCGRTAAGKKTIEKHIMYHHLTSACTCGLVFRSRERLRRHARIAHAAPGDAAAYCVECDVSFPTRGKYRRHLATAARHRPRQRLSIPCPECGKIFSRKSYMKNHLKLFHTNDSKHHCVTCDKYFVTGYALRSHNMYVHEKMPKPKTKICNVCGRLFGTNRVLANHMRTHTGERPFACARCSAAFAQKVALRAHLAAIHKEK